jgi:hypothetical protein
MHLANTLVFYFEALLYVLLDCALVTLGTTFLITLVNPISWWNIVSLWYA